ncbi:MAG: glycosyltransferase family 2 protein [bacterium]
MSKKRMLSLVVPAYNEKGNIPIFMERVENIRDKLGCEVEVIVVDDGSYDGTYEEVKALKERYPYLRILRHPHNRGLTAALDSGFSNARGDILAFYPADLQYDPAELPKLIAKLNEGYDIVAGWRQGKYEKAFVSWVYNSLCRILFRLKIHDLNSVKVIKREVYDRFVMRQDWHRYLIPLAASEGYLIGEEKVTLYPRRYGKSKFKGPWRAIVGLLDLISVKFITSFMKKPMLIFGTAGLISLSLSIIIGIIAFYYRFVLQKGYRPIIYLVILLFLAGLLLFAIGFITELLSTILFKIDMLSSKLRNEKNKSSQIP